MSRIRSGTRRIGRELEVGPVDLDQLAEVGDADKPALSTSAESAARPSRTSSSSPLACPPRTPAGSLAAAAALDRGPK